MNPMKNKQMTESCQLTKVRLVHGLASRQSFLMIVAQQLIKQVQRLGTHELLVLTVNKTLPTLPRMPSHTQTPTHIQTLSFTEEMLKY